MLALVRRWLGVDIPNDVWIALLAILVACLRAGMPPTATAMCLCVLLCGGCFGTGVTVITKDLAIDSLAVMDMVMEIEDRFDVSIPMNVVAEIYTVDELADTVLKLRAKR